MSTDDLAELEDLDDDILCECLKTRYEEDKIYTYVGDILIAINPFVQLGLYTSEVSAKYCNVHDKSSLPPHLFATADAAFHAMNRSMKPQVCVISGESGAGKTESAKQFIRQIMDVSARGIMGGSGADDEGVVRDRARHPIESKIIQQNPILESFGNAKTVMNDNSSRFGKFIQLKFGSKGMVEGAEMQHYLLEKARIVMQGPGERNYHVFGMLFSGLSVNHLAKYHLTEMSDFKYMPENDFAEESVMIEMWKELQQAFTDCDFLLNETDEIFSILAAILHFGNVDFVEGDNGDAAVIGNPETATILSELLKINEADLREALMTSVLNMRGDIIVKANNITKCQNARNATSKALYDKLFQWIIYKLNLTLRAPSSAVLNGLHIAILDIFGFENFNINGFDQMCINLANEQLHYFFNNHIFADEIQAYISEGLEMDTEFIIADNKKVLDLFFKRPMGLLALLDEECDFPNSSEKSLLAKFNKNLEAQPLYKVLKGDYSFGIAHYAGTITYHGKGFLEKNTDPLPSLIPSVFESGNSMLLKMMFSSEWDLSEVTQDSRGKSKRGMSLKLVRQATQKKKRMSRKGSKRASAKGNANANNSSTRQSTPGQKDSKVPHTVSAHFRISLDALMLKMNQCDPHFVRCIKPNGLKTPKVWELDLVVRQLEYTGMLQTIKMRRDGYPSRIPFADFYNAYHGIVFDFVAQMRGGAASTCNEMLTKIEAKVEATREEQGLTSITTSLKRWKITKNMVFLKYWQPDLLDGLLHPFGVKALIIQCAFRQHLARKIYKPMKQKFADELASAATFVSDVAQRSSRLRQNLDTLIEEEIRRGVWELGIAEKVDEKKAKKLEKELAKGVLAKTTQIDRKKFDKDLEKDKKNVLKWWNRMEKGRKVHLSDEGTIHPWFHGLISRIQAEDYLVDQVSGAFLVRVSERVHGYALSFRHHDKIRHYKLGFSSEGGYEVTGNNEDFPTLDDLVSFYRDNAITQGSDDVLLKPIQFDHDLGLGLSTAEMQRISVVPRNEMSQEMIAKASVVKTPTKVADSEPMPYRKFLDNYNPPPRWFRGKMSRQEAETELEDRGMADGRFLVREKLRAATKVVLALSVSYRNKFYHHLLTKDPSGAWTLDEKPMSFNQGLEAMINYLQRKKSPRLATILESDVPKAPTEPRPAPEQPASPSPVKAKKQTNRSNLIPSNQSTVDDVVAWLASLGLAKYAGGFYKSKIDGAMLHAASEKQLRKFVKSEDDLRLMIRALR
eukprot:m.193634 g.193634  ORF g.193634 m.193634 type:complete len:1246 (-) comp32511_c1_seq1:49-3786(-)